MMGMFDKWGHPISLGEWQALFEDKSYCIIKQDTIDGIQISTVWLGLDHRFGGDGDPLIFETMVFRGGLDNEQWRYSTLEEADQGHARACDLVRLELAART